MLNAMNYEIIPMPLKSKSWSYYEIWFRPGHLLGWDIEDLRETLHKSYTTFEEAHTSLLKYRKEQPDFVWTLRHVHKTTETQYDIVLVPYEKE